MEQHILLRGWIESENHANEGENRLNDQTVKRKKFCPFGLQISCPFFSQVLRCLFVITIFSLDFSD